MIERPQPVEFGLVATKTIDFVHLTVTENRRWLPLLVLSNPSNIKSDENTPMWVGSAATCAERCKSTRTTHKPKISSNRLALSPKLDCEKRTSKCRSLIYILSSLDFLSAR